MGKLEEELLGLVERVEKYVQVFIDDQSSRSVEQEIRSLLSGSVVSS